MEDLTLDDVLQAVGEIREVEFLGKRAYLRALSFDAQLKLAARHQDPDREASHVDMLYVLGCVLCNRDGALLFESADAAVKALGNVPSPAVLALFASVSEINALDIEAEVKK